MNEFTVSVSVSVALPVAYAWLYSTALLWTASRIDLTPLPPAPDPPSHLCLSFLYSNPAAQNKVVRQQLLIQPAPRKTLQILQNRSPFPRMGTGWQPSLHESPRIARAFAYAPLARPGQSAVCPLHSRCPCQRALARGPCRRHYRLCSHCFRDGPRRWCCHSCHCRCRC